MLLIDILIYSYTQVSVDHKQKISVRNFMTISEAFLQGEPELVSVQHLLTDFFRLEVTESTEKDRDEQISGN